ncbi:unnamed protein product, partial [Rotaria sp. Silwood2]
ILFQQSTSLSPSQTKHLKKKNSAQNYPSSLIKSKPPVCIETDYIEESSKVTNKSNYLNDILMDGKYMNDVDFENLIKDQASDFYWEVLAERARIKLVDQHRENQQLHELLDELIKEHRQLEEKTQPYENLINIFKKIMSIKKENNNCEENKSNTNGIKTLLLFHLLQLLQEKEQWLQEKQQLLQEKEQLLQKKQQLFQEKQQLLQEKQQLFHQKQQLFHQKQQLLQEKQLLQIIENMKK